MLRIEEAAAATLVQRGGVPPALVADAATTPHDSPAGQRSRNWLVALALIVIAAALAAPDLADQFAAHETVLSAPFTARGGNAWIAPLPGLARFADDLASTNRSRLMLFEDDRQLGPAHTLHDDIGRFGQGRFSHWRGELVFSASDNTDPNTNGRRYRVRLAPPILDRSLLGYIAVGFLLPAAVAIVVAGLPAIPVLSLLLGSRSAAPAACFMLCAVGSGIVALLAANIIDVSTWWSAIAHFGLALLIAATGGAVLFALQPLRSSRPIAARLLIVWLFASGLTLGTEALVRAAPIADTLAPNPGNKFFWPDWRSYPLNNFGYRDRNFEVPKPPRVFRILLLGDSYVEGAGLSRRQTFGRLVEDQLNREIAARGSRLRVQVLNMGHSGFNTWEEWQSLAADGPRLHPDLVILNYVVNDAEVHRTPVNSAVTDVHTFLLERVGSYAYYFGLSYAHLFEFARGSFADFVIAQHEDPVGWGALSAGLKHIGEWCRSRRVPALGLLWPVFTSPQWQTQLSPVYAKVGQAMARTGLAVHSLVPVFLRADGNPANFAFSSHDWHPNARANEIVASWLDEQVKKIPEFDIAIDENR